MWFVVKHKTYPWKCQSAQIRAFQGHVESCKAGTRTDLTFKSGINLHEQDLLKSGWHPCACNVAGAQTQVAHEYFPFQGPLQVTGRSVGMNLVPDPASSALRCARSSTCPQTPASITPGFHPAPRWASCLGIRGESVPSCWLCRSSFRVYCGFYCSWKLQGEDVSCSRVLLWDVMLCIFVMVSDEPSWWHFRNGPGSCTGWVS